MNKLKAKSSKRKVKILNPKFLILTLGFALCVMRCAPAQPVSSTELINNAKLYDGKVVIYAGEVIGDVMVRGNHAWVNVNDERNAVGIWVDKSLTKDILYTGSYKSKGDLIEVTGIFHRACPEHGGDLDIHAQALRKLNSGKLLAERMNKEKKNFALTLLGALCLVLILRQLKPKLKK